MMGCLSTGLHILLAGRSIVPEDVLLCDVDSECSGQQELPQSTIVKENADLLRESAFCHPDGFL